METEPRGTVYIARHGHAAPAESEREQALRVARATVPPSVNRVMMRPMPPLAPRPDSSLMSAGGAERAGGAWLGGSLIPALMRPVASGPPVLDQPRDALAAAAAQSPRAAGFGRAPGAAYPRAARLLLDLITTAGGGGGGKPEAVYYERAVEAALAVAESEFRSVHQQQLDLQQREMAAELRDMEARLEGQRRLLESFGHVAPPPPVRGARTTGGGGRAGGAAAPVRPSVYSHLPTPPGHAGRPAPTPAAAPAPMPAPMPAPAPNVTFPQAKGPAADTPFGALRQSLGSSWGDDLRQPAAGRPAAAAAAKPAAAAAEEEQAAVKIQAMQRGKVARVEMAAGQALVALPAEELAKLKLSELRRRGLAAGLSEAEVDGAVDAVSPPPPPLPHTMRRRVQACVCRTSRMPRWSLCCRSQSRRPSQRAERRRSRQQ
jgi:hypothetical protein